MLQRDCNSWCKRVQPIKSIFLLLPLLSSSSLIFFFCDPSDASRLLSPSGPGSLQEVMCIISCGPSANHVLPGTLSGLLGALRLQTPTVGRHHHPGLHQRHDCSPAVQEAEGRGRHTHTHLRRHYNVYLYSSHQNQHYKVHINTKIKGTVWTKQENQV